ncbi:MAG: hypothetical protein KTR20_09890 [Cellvibrionaceae bacterium]|nr:hypothetical protein [Cellvibrionaceae bacterium]
MGLCKHFNSSIAATQFALAVCAGLWVGIILSGIYLSYYLVDQHRGAMALARQTLDALKPEASRIARRADTAKAEQLAAQLIAMEVIEAVDFIGAQHTVLSQRVSAQPTQRLQWLFARNRSI